MLTIKNNIAYIEEKDIHFIGIIPKNVCECIDFEKQFSKFNFLKIKNAAIDFFKENDLILKYSDIKDLSIEEIKLKLNQLSSELDKLCDIWLNSSTNERKKLDKNQKYISKIENLKYLTSSLNEYIENKKSYDDIISKLLAKKDENDNKMVK